jgi:hypothetical protein
MIFTYSLFDQPVTHSRFLTFTMCSTNFYVSIGGKFNENCLIFLFPEKFILILSNVFDKQSIFKLTANGGLKDQSYT